MLIQEYVRVAMAALAVLCLGASLPARAASLEGVWQVNVTRIDCTSREPAAPNFTSLLEFSAGGTESEATNNPQLKVGQRSTAFGVWSKTGVDKYRLDTFALILFPSTGSHPLPQGSQQIHQDITLSGASWSSEATVQYFNTSGTLVFTGCATAAAARLS